MTSPADPAKLRELAMELEDSDLYVGDGAAPIRAAAARIESQAAEIAELREKLESGDCNNASYCFQQSKALREATEKLAAAEAERDGYRDKWQGCKDGRVRAEAERDELRSNLYQTASKLAEAEADRDAFRAHFTNEEPTP